MSKAEQAGKPRIAAGFRIGKLVGESPTDERKNGYTVWMCRCDCGNTISLDTRCLQRGTVCDCGCETKVKPGQKDLMGQRFGKLTAVDSAGYTGKGKTLVWRCLCDCGNEVMVEGKLLTGGKTKSCGCIGKTEQDNQIGKRFGQLVVTGYHGKKNRMHYWECLCDCGKTAIVNQVHLQTGKTKSCGCLQAKMAAQNMKFVDGTSVAIIEKVGKRLNDSNTSGHNGVYWNQKAQKWMAQIGFKGKRYYLGLYAKLEDAVRVRKTAEEKLYGEFLEWYYETCSKKDESE